MLLLTCYYQNRSTSPSAILHLMKSVSEQHPHVAAVSVFYLLNRVRVIKHTQQIQHRLFHCTPTPLVRALPSLCHCPKYTKVSLCCAQISRDANKKKKRLQWNWRQFCSVHEKTANHERKNETNLRQNETISCTIFAITAPEITESCIMCVCKNIDACNLLEKLGCAKWTDYCYWSHTSLKQNDFPLLD